MPSLAKLVNPRSWLLFSLIEMSEAERDWLRFPSTEWKIFAGYRRFFDLTRKLQVVNDSAERTVKATEQVVGKTTIETIRQDMLLTNCEDRKIHPNRGKGKQSKAHLGKI